MDKLKNDDQLELYDKKLKLMNEIRKLVLYDGLITIYNTAFAVSISYAWESFAELLIESTFSSVSAGTIKFLIKTAYAIIVTILLIQYALFLYELRRQRLIEGVRRRRRRKKEREARKTKSTELAQEALI